MSHSLHLTAAAKLPYFVCVNWQSAAGSDAILVVVAETRRAAVSDPAGDWLCVWCLQRIANDRDRFSYGGRDEFTFSNPEKVRFEIITFARARGVRQAGEPTLEHTWFPGHAWLFCLCAQCGQHLGWFYTGPTSFAGPIEARLVRALHVRN